jgi:hypothetical protein
MPSLISEVFAINFLFWTPLYAEWFPRQTREVTKVYLTKYTQPFGLPACKANANVLTLLTLYYNFKQDLACMHHRNMLLPCIL